MAGGPETVCPDGRTRKCAEKIRTNLATCGRKESPPPGPYVSPLNGYSTVKIDTIVEVHGLSQRFLMIFFQDFPEFQPIRPPRTSQGQQAYGFTIGKKKRGSFAKIHDSSAGCRQMEHKRCSFALRRLCRARRPIPVRANRPAAQSDSSAGIK